MNARPYLVAGLVGLLLAGPAALRAEDPKPGPVEVRIYDVTALVAGAPAFFGEQVGVYGSQLEPDGRPDPISAEEGEEPFGSPLGTPDELIERLKQSVRPGSWGLRERDAKSMGWRRLVVRQDRPTHEEIARWLAAVEDESLRSVEVEVVAVPVDLGTVLPVEATEVGALIDASEDALRTSLAAYAGQTAAAFEGRRIAFLEASAQPADAQRPPSGSRDGVVLEGLSVRVELSPTSRDDRIDLRLGVSVGRVLGIESDRGEDEGAFERPRLASQRTITALTLVPERWTWTQGAQLDAGGWSVAVRARRAPSRRGAPSVGTLLEPIATHHAGPLAAGRIPIAWFNHKPTARPLYGIEEIRPQGVPVSEPAELYEAAERLAPEALVELLRCPQEPSDWPGDWSLDWRSSTLHIQAPLEAVTELRDRVALLERLLDRALAVDVRLVEVPTRFAAPSAGAWPATAEKALEAALADGSARALDHVHLLSDDGWVAGVSAGTLEHLVRGHEVVSEPGSRTLRPDVRCTFDGIAVDVTPIPWSAGERLSATVRLLRTWVEKPVRTLDTPAGTVALPSARTLLLRTTCDLALGETTVVGSTSANGRRTFALLTVRPQP